MVSMLGAGAALGLSAGISPGPLLALVISQTIRYGYREGVKVAVAPLITDFPIILGSTFLLVKISHYRSVIGYLSLAGGVFLVYLAYGSFRTGGLAIRREKPELRSVVQGAVVNALNPHPYLFWFTVGGPMVVKGYSAGLLPPVLFVSGFLGCLVGSKIALAVVVEKSRDRLVGKPYVWTMRILGVALLGFAFVLFRDGADLIIRS